jgi:hypothetical protein
MDRIETNRRFLADLFAGNVVGRALIYDGPRPSHLKPGGDYAVLTDRPVDDWLAFYEEDYAWKRAQSRAFADDAVPYVNLCGTTGFFAAAFGCAFHSYAHGGNPVARPLVTTAEEADALSRPTLEDGPIPRYFELAEKLAKRLGPDVPISVPDVQSPFGIAAIIWNKEDLLIALLETPEAVLRLVDKTHRLLADFLEALKRRLPNVNFVHCPYTWAPPELGCWLSEDEIGIISAEMFETFALGSLAALSEQFGGLMMHCCAAAQHQYDQWRKIPNLRAINPAIFEEGPAGLIRMMPDKVYMYGYQSEERMLAAIEAAGDRTSLLFNIAGKEEVARPIFDRLREHCPGAAAGAEAR